MLHMPHGQHWEYYRPPRNNNTCLYRPIHSLQLQRRTVIRKCGSLCTVAVIATTILIVLLLMVAFALNLSQTVHIIHIDLDTRSHSVNDKFLSVALDTITISKGFKGFNMTDGKLLKVVKEMSPGYLRVGGTLADRLLFSEDDTSNSLIRGRIPDCQYDCINAANFVMTGRQWLNLNKFANNVGLQILFDLNALQRFTNGTWNYQNAEQLIKFSSNHKLKLIWELGNEPDSFKHTFNYEVDPGQLGDDFITLRNILHKYPLYTNSLVVGPDTTRPKTDHRESENYLRAFLSKAGHAIDAVTWHQYYFNGRTVLPSSFIDPDQFDILKWQITAIKFILKDSNIPDKPIWLGETSSAYGGGAPGLSNGFIATFIWLDKLGLAAKMGLDLVIRQTIFHGNYALLDDNYTPTPIIGYMYCRFAFFCGNINKNVPLVICTRSVLQYLKLIQNDWWVSVLYKKLIGPKVVSCYTALSQRVRLYCQCSKTEPAVIVFGMNMAESVAKIRIQSQFSSEETQVLYVDAYILNTRITLASRKIYLNGDLLELTSSNDLPSLRPKVIPAQPYIVLPPYSLVFLVVPLVASSMCSRDGINTSYSTRSHPSSSYRTCSFGTPQASSTISPSAYGKSSLRPPSSAQYQNLTYLAPSNVRYGRDTSSRSSLMPPPERPPSRSSSYYMCQVSKKSRTKSEGYVIEKNSSMSYCRYRKDDDDVFN